MNNIQKHSDSSGPLALRNAMDRLFNESFWDPFGSFFNMSDGLLSRVNRDIDLSETDKEIIVELDIPGYNPKDIKVSLEDNLLTISGTMKDDTDSEHRKYYKRERRYGSFQKSITLPRYTVLEDIDCTHQNGSLKIVIPKSDSKSQREIDVKIK